LVGQPLRWPWPPERTPDRCCLCGSIGPCPHDLGDPLGGVRYLRGGGEARPTSRAGRHTRGGGHLRVGPFVYIVMWFFTAVGSRAWFYVFLVTAALQLAAAYVAPALLLPLFLELIPLPRGTALIICEGGSDSIVPKFLSGRAFYESDQGFHGKPCWQTSDRRFAGAAAGSTLSIWWSPTAHSEGSGPIYATCASLILERHADGEIPRTLWPLTAEAAVAGDHSGTAGPAESGGLQGPLAQDLAWRVQAQGFCAVQSFDEPS